jgi:uncharacterized membrane protein
MLRKATPEHLSALSDGIFAVLITVLVLDLRPPELPTFASLLSEWPTGLSYAVSYVFIAIVWANHHHLMRYATQMTGRLMWFTFAHLFSASLLPLATAWMAVSELAPQPVAFYAIVFLLVNLAYLALAWELVRPSEEDEMPVKLRRTMLVRGTVTAGLFALSAVVALYWPLAGLTICICCLATYLWPDVPGNPRRAS